MTIEKIKNAIMCIIQKLIPADNNGGFDESLETDSTTTGRSYFPEYTKIIAHALYDENKDVLVAMEFIGKLSQKQFLNNAGDIISKGEIIDNVTTILQYAKQLKNNDQFIDITERLLSFQDQRIFKLYSVLYASNLSGNFDDEFFQAVSEIDDEDMKDDNTVEDSQKMVSVQ